MENFFLKFICLQVLLCICCKTQVATLELKRVKLDVYYETHCPDSVDFFNNHLKNAIANFENQIAVELIPFGKASYWKTFFKRDWNFMCQHGEIECFGNKLHV